ncbi:MAG: cysteine--1-D-myo-inosityl 2-amino-2-deoxy-alpha-D-glucopyranoside ligase [Streptosporangiales bacterium]|nr:cysteine--1-D-myo-inosityl 2-amino-2-deoxy-alpha-D-glucopyranoside ligase [Streptosporangiales bacterium]
MDSWTAPSLPRLPGSGRQLALHDTASGTRLPTPQSSTARMYTCGITPYDATHLGHAATYVASDLIVRIWRDAGHEVRYVQNVTDVDDPLLERAQRDDQDWRELAEREIERFRNDMVALRLVPPAAFVGAVEAIPQIADMIETLKGSGAVYDLQGDLYYPVRVDPDFGSVSHLDHDAMVRLSAENGGDPERPGKQDPVDPQLWRRAREGEPSWDSPFGPGRPGWHVECAAIALTELGTTYDVAAGGRDLVFPHHEMSTSHARVATGDRGPYVHSHAGLVALDGEKMSKSKGNLVFVSHLREQGADPMAIRLGVLAHHYRSDWEWRAEDLTEASERLASWRSAASAAAGPSGTEVLTALRERLADDLDAPGALAAIDAWAEAVHRGEGDDTEAPGLVRAATDALLGVEL